MTSTIVRRGRGRVRVGLGESMVAGVVALGGVMVVMALAAGREVTVLGADVAG